MNTSDLFRPGDWVLWFPYKGCCQEQWVKGRVSRCGEDIVWVVYNCAGDWENWRDYTAEGTNPDYLLLEKDFYLLVDLGLI
jgi:hypothetical protein